MDENPQSPPPSGWTFGKIVGAVVGIISMVGFGVCSLCGLVLAVDYSEAWIFVLGGVGMTALSTWFVMSLFRKVREARQSTNSDKP